MSSCPACTAEVPASARFCPACGKTIDAAASADWADHRALTPIARPTRPRRGPPRSTRRAPRARRRRAAAPIDRRRRVRFAPGAIVAGPLSHRRAARPGRHGRGLPRRRPDARPAGRAEVPARGARRRRRRGSTLPRRSAHRAARSRTRTSAASTTSARSTATTSSSMEYVDGEDLASLLRRIGRLPEDKALEIARQLCAGLAAAHDQGVLHRDLKPANVMIDGRGNVAHHRLRPAPAPAGDADATRAGTPAYMAPEQLAGQRGDGPERHLRARPRALRDLHRPRARSSAKTLARAARAARERHADDADARSSAISTPPIERVILRCLERDPARRPALGARGGGGAAGRRSARGGARRRRDAVARDGGRGRRDRARSRSAARSLGCARARGASARSPSLSVARVDPPRWSRSTSRPRCSIDRIAADDGVARVRRAGRDRRVRLPVPPDYLAWARRRARGATGGSACAGSPPGAASSGTGRARVR